MPIKVENASEIKLPRNFYSLVENIILILPREHIRGIDRIRFVDTIKESQLRKRASSRLPALYHPKQSTQSAWLEIATATLIGSSEPFPKRMLLRLSFKSNLASLIISLVGQHYYSTLRHSVKRIQMDSAIRTYTEKHLKIWARKEHKFRARFFKPFESRLENWMKSLRHKAEKDRAKSHLR